MGTTASLLRSSVSKFQAARVPRTLEQVSMGTYTMNRICLVGW